MLLYTQTIEDPRQTRQFEDIYTACRGRLPPRCREALLLRYGCGYSTRETASLLELSFAAAQKLLQRAKAALRQELEKEGLTV